MKSTMKVIGAAALVLVLTACNTIEGVGQDVEATGDKIEDVADHNKPE